MNDYPIRILVIALMAFALNACTTYNEGNILPDKRVEYKKSRQAENALEVPPDLSQDTIAQGGVMFSGSSPAVTTYSEYQAARSGAPVSGRSSRNVLPDNPQIEVRRDGDKRWLVIQAPAEAVWDTVLDFWQENGILLVEQDPSAGVMRTTWIENRADIKTDMITNFLRKAVDGLYAAGTRDQYRVRLERAGSGTELFLTHTGMREQLVSGIAETDTDQSVWIPSGSDQELEAVMLQKLMAFMGTSEARAQEELGSTAGTTSKRVSTLYTGSDSPYMAIHTDFARSWRLVGIALNRVGFTVEDRNRSAGDYYVRYNDPSDDVDDEGWLSNLAFWSSSDKGGKSEVFVVNVSGEEPATVTVRNQNGNPAPAQTASRILTLLHEQLR
ncbi:MAG: outer membrane protein assembly factor BamC [Chromatiales bacterium]